MGKVGPLCLTSLLFIMKCPHLHIYSFLPLQLHLLHLLHLLPLLPSLLRLLRLQLALSALGDPDLSGLQSNGQIPQRYRQIRGPFQPFLLQMRKIATLMTPLIAHSASAVEPTTYKLFQQQSDADLWRTACEEETEAHKVNGTWEIVKLPPGKRAIGSRWFLKVKCNADGSLDRYKGRVIAKGYSQCPGFDFKKAFPPLFAISPFAPSWPLQCWRTLSFALWTFHMAISIAL